MTKGRNATTHSGAKADLAAQGETVINARVVDDGDLITGAASPPAWRSRSGSWSGSSARKPPSEWRLCWSTNAGEPCGAGDGVDRRRRAGRAEPRHPARAARRRRLGRGGGKRHLQRDRNPDPKHPITLDKIVEQLP
ncbi:hypothetical protein [Kibdelosporangium aridum]|uniref:hypothetical protein n=1 Tax=Kibdelosporangium aridum TaxID=2030 RepID=UPI0021AE1EEE|nr:hypothetical protein [Kibdelosporangium aridum]